MKIKKTLRVFYQYFMHGPITTTIIPKSDTNSLLSIQINGYGWKAISATTEYAKNYYTLFSDTKVTQYYWGGAKDIKWVQTRLRVYENRLKDDNPFSGFAIFKQDKFMGHAVFGSPSSSGESEIAYIFHTEFWGNGYGQQVTNTLVDIFQPTLKYYYSNLHENINKVQSVRATSHPDNIASNKILLNAGFEQSAFKKGAIGLHDRNVYIKKATSTLPILLHNVLVTEKAISVGLDCVKIGLDFNNDSYNPNNFINLAHKVTHLIGLYTPISPVVLMTIDVLPIAYDTYHNGIYASGKNLFESSIFLTAQFFLQNTPGFNLIYYPVLIAYSTKLLLDEFNETYAALYNKLDNYGQHKEDVNTVGHNYKETQDQSYQDNEHQVEY